MADNSFYDDFCGCEACMRREKIYFADLEKEANDEKNTPHEIIIHEGELATYRGVALECHNDRYMVVSNTDLLKLGICTPKTIQRGHKGYKSLATLMKRIDKGLGD